MSSKEKLIVGQVSIWMGCMLVNTIAITVVENVFDEFRYGMVCTVSSITIMMSMPFALAHLQRFLRRSEQVEPSDADG